MRRLSNCRWRGIELDGGAGILFGLLVGMLLAIQPLDAEDEGQKEASQSESGFLSGIRQLTYDGRRSGEGYFDSEGDALIFQSEREPGNPFYQIYLLNLKTGESHRVSPGIGKTTCAYFRPGTDEVLFASTHLDPKAKAKQREELKFRQSGKERRYSWDYDKQMDIFVSRRDGSDRRRLTDALGYDAEASYSPSGKQIVFTSLRSGYPTNRLSGAELKQLKVNPAYFGELYLMDADGSDVRRLTHRPGYDGGPFFSPDGNRIVWRAFDKEGVKADVYTMNLEGRDVRQLTQSESMCWAPYYHPSGKYVIFTSNKHGFSNFELFLVDVEGKQQPVRVTYSEGFDGLPVFGPKGERLCWTSKRGVSGRSQLFMAQWSHEAAMKALAKAPERSSSPPSSLDAKFTDGPENRSKAGSKTGGEPQSEAATKADRDWKVAMTTEDARAQVGYLASDALEGRLTGTAGTKKASEYLAAYFERIGLKPLGSEESFFQTFEFTSGVEAREGENELALNLGKNSGDHRSYEAGKDFQPLSFTANGEVKGEIVFAGYGLKVPGENGEGYNAYEGLDVKGKIVLVLRYVPEEVSMERRRRLNMYSGLRYKAMIAREAGAKALMVTTGPNSPNAGELVSLSFDNTLSGSAIPAISITGKVARRLFEASGRDLEAVQSELDVANPHAETRFPLKGVRARLKTGVDRITDTDRNVIGYLPPEDGAKKASDAPHILVGAHYDHIGRGELGSLAGKEGQGKIHNGADDNASGVSVVMELAHSLAAAKNDESGTFRQGIVFAFWSGEELGLVGSSHYSEQPLLPLDQLNAYLNFDMVGRLRENRLILQGVGSSGDWGRLIEKANVPAGFQLKIKNDPYLPTDATAFYPEGVPVLNFFTGTHDDYNRPSDDPKTLNYQGMIRTGKFAKSVVEGLAAMDTKVGYKKVEEPTSKKGGQAELRVYLGTIPDYTSDVQGVKLSGVRSGGPADKAGLKGGDIIVEFGEQKITNIYDYTYAIDSATIGEPVEVVVKRDGERKTLEVVPAARE